MQGDTIQALRELAWTSRSLNDARQRNERVIRVIGHDAPYCLIRAAGCLPIRLAPDPGRATPLADKLIGTATMSRRARTLLDQVLADKRRTPLLITHTDAESPQIFAALRELMNCGDIEQRPIHFLDLLHLPRASSRDYNRIRVEQFASWLEREFGAAVTVDSWRRASAEEEHRTSLLAEACALRDLDTPQLTGGEVFTMTNAACTTPHETWAPLMQNALQQAQAGQLTAGRRVIIAGAARYTDAVHRQLHDAGYQVVGDYRECADLALTQPALEASWVDSMANPARMRTLSLIPAAERVAELLDLVRRRAADHVIYLAEPGDEPSGWDAGPITRLLHESGLMAGVWHTERQFPAQAQLFRAANTSRRDNAAQTRQGTPPLSKEKSRRQGQRSRKSLSSIADFNSYQRSWFQALRGQVSEGAPFAMVNANSPQEILRAMDIPFVVNQWWASIVAAKQQSRRYSDLLREHDYPADVESYSAQGLAALFDDDEDKAPWGGLPHPDFVQALRGTDATACIFDHWARESGATPFLFERTVDPRIEIPVEWWDLLPDQWNQALESERLDLLTAELRQLIDDMESRLGKRFDQQKFVEIMRLVNEQEEYYRQTRDLIAGASPAPVSIVDTMPATMIPQWHRGTVWARDAAKAFYNEVKSRVEAGEGTCPQEKLRLMWVGRGMWSDMGFYQRWQESHGAVFVWSMYLGLAADGYIRNFDDKDDPLRALAARFVTVGDELRMPTWAGAWHVKEAQNHAVHGAVALSDADPFVLRALERAGIPVLSLDLDNYNQANKEECASLVEAFLNELA